METQNPRSGLAPRAGKTIAAVDPTPNRIRPVLQANRAMRARLDLLLWEVRHA